MNLKEKEEKLTKIISEMALLAPAKDKWYELSWERNDLEKEIKSEKESNDYWKIIRETDFEDFEDCGWPECTEDKKICGSATFTSEEQVKRLCEIVSTYIYEWSGAGKYLLILERNYNSFYNEEYWSATFKKEQDGKDT